MIHWSKPYERLAHSLLKFSSKSPNQTGKLLYRLCLDSSAFIKANPWIIKFGEFRIRSIDPIHIFASFNEAKLSDEKRQERIEVFFGLLREKPDNDSIDFSGCPSPFSIKIMAARSPSSQNTIWKIFRQVVSNKKNAINQDTFNSLEKLYGIDISSFTIFLFWIRSSIYISLDKNTVGFLISTGNLTSRINDFDNYQALLNRIPKEYYQEIVKQAPIFMQDIDEQKYSIPKKLHDFLFGREKASTLFDFKLVSIRPLGRTSPQLLKILKPNEYYTFYHCFEFTKDTLVKYDSKKDFKQYSFSDNEGSLKINISAIVGKNGSGKSTITELLFVFINNLSHILLNNNQELEFVPKLNIQVFFHYDSLYKIELRGSRLRLFKYKKQVEGYDQPEEIPPSKTFLKSFFYTISVNYSHYALNSNQIGDWIAPMFMKNDSYQIPLVINPMRVNGNIEINTENTLIKSRLLAGILEPVSENELNNIRKITENGREAKQLVFTLNKDKIKYIYENIPYPPLSEEWHQASSLIDKHYKISRNQKKDLSLFVHKYIYKKLVNISMKYDQYSRFQGKKRYSLNLSLLPTYLNELSNDSSHITYKLRQAVNFLKYGHLSFIKESKPFPVDVISNSIQKIIEKKYNEKRLRIIELIPPSFFNIKIILNDGSDFDHLSSGEKQLIHTTYSLIYHLLNINSVLASKDLVKYSFVNVILDEIELYFHPEMQRSFINYVLKSLRKIELNDVFGINFCFVTHSPFILSDIPSQNILFLNQKGRSLTVDERIKTFGANIHDLIRHSFFLQNGSMGKFVQEKISQTIEYLNYRKLEDLLINEKINNKLMKALKKDLSSAKERINDFDPDRHKEIIDLIDEPILKIKLVQMFDEIQNGRSELAFVRNQILELQKTEQQLQAQN